ncbi:MAG: ABC transporter permease, partial [Bacteroidales bacterium]|nr:ABC transporter permease [Bacteroidales bacterium]
STLFTGILSGIIIATTTIFLITRSKSKEPVKVMISKSPSLPINYPEKKYLMNTLIIIFAFGLASALVVYSLFGDVDQNAGLFLPAGGLFLLGGIASIFRIMVKGQQHFHTLPLSWFQLSLKNAGRNRAGSISTIALLALGTFTIMITGANQQTFYGVSNDRSSGTGGFSMWVENAVPIIYDLNTHTGKEKYGLEDDPVFENVKFLQFHSLEGDDASCLNLNQVDRPRVLGVDAKIFDANKSFSFASLHKSIDASRPWLSLDKKFESGVIPAFADQTVITWGLMKKVGDTLTYLNEQGNPIKLLLAGGLKNSIFQGNILIADSIFMANYPSAGGTEIMLVETPADEAGKVTNILEERLTDYGLEITSTKTRLATFNSVTNTYLSVFMILGGLGVLIGTIGLGIVLLRNIMERKAELALLLAIGFRKTEILKTIFLENFILLLAGNTLGFFAALIGILPSLLSPAFAMNTRFIILLILMVFISGLLWIYFPARQSLKRFSIKDLHEE